MKKTIKVTFEYLDCNSQYGGFLLDIQDDISLNRIIDSKKEYTESDKAIFKSLEANKLTGTTLMYLASVGLDTLSMNDIKTNFEFSLDEISETLKTYIHDEREDG